MVIIDTVVNTLFGGLTLDPAGMHCPAGDDAFVSSVSSRDIFASGPTLASTRTCLLWILLELRMKNLMYH